MKKNKPHSDEELLKRLQDEAPEILKAEIGIDLDEAIKALISSPKKTIQKPHSGHKRKSPAQRK